MGNFAHYPYINFSDLNLDWVLSKIKELKSDYDKLSDWETKHTAEYAELKKQVAGLIQNMTQPVEPWDGTKEYTRYTLVSYEGETYIALKDVPAGVLITNSEYWGVAQTIQAELNAIKSDIIEIERHFCKVYDTVAEMISDFKATDFVCTVRNSRIIFNGVGTPFEVPCNCPNYYTYEEENDAGAHYFVLDSGGFASVMQHEFEARINDISILPKIMKTAYSYMGVYKESGFNVEGETVYNVRYVSSSGPYFEDAASHQGMQCSQFVNAILHGMPFDRSKLANESYINMPSYGKWSGIVLDDGTEWYGAAEELAQYAYATGKFIETDNIDDAVIGDIVFMASNTSEDFNLDWKNIVHCAVVVGKVRGALQVVQCGGITRIDGFASNVVRAGESTDGVNIQTIYTYDNLTDTHYRSENYWMAGIARFEMGFSKLAENDTVTLTPIPNTEYAAGAANVGITPDPIPASPVKNALFAIVNVQLTTGATDNNANFFMSGWTYATAFPAQTGQTIFGSSMTNAGGVFVCPFRKDGDTKTIRLAMTIRTRDSSQGGFYNIESGIIKTYV